MRVPGKTLFRNALTYHVSRITNTMKLPVYKADGGKTRRKVVLDASVFGITPNDHVLWLDVRRLQASRRQGTHKTKERGEVAGSPFAVVLAVRPVPRRSRHSKSFTGPATRLNLATRSWSMMSL